ncbi:14740_t:CDS:2, partial [Entrophospora sp. SA101]
IDGVRFLWKNIVMFNKGCVLAHSMGLAYAAIIRLSSSLVGIKRAKFRDNLVIFS